MPDEYQPAGRAPDAVIRRQGDGAGRFRQMETRDQMQMRHSGYSDEQTGFGYRGGSPMARAAQIAINRDRVAQADQRLIMDANKLTLDEEKFRAQQAIQQQAMKDKAAAIEQTGKFLADVEAAAKAHTRGSKEFYGAALAAAQNYPAAIHSDPRLGAMLNHYGDQFAKIGGTPEQATALWELGQVDPRRPETRDYLRTIPGKYPGAIQDKSVASLFERVSKEAESYAAERAVPQGLVPSGATVNPKGEVTTRFDTPKQEKDAVLGSLEKERAMHVNMLDRAKRIRSKATDESVIADADADIQESTRALTDIESQIRSQRGGETTARTEDDAAVAWANKNPNDPRAAAILKLQGGK